MKATATYQNSAPLRPSGSRLVDNWEGTQGNTLTVKGYGEMVEPFWGPPSRKLDDDQSTRYPHEAYFLQDAYAGRNDYIRQTIVYAVVNQNSFMTRVILPWRHQENPNIAWEKVQFNRTLADLEPEQGVPRYVTVEKEKHSDAMVRRGLALIVNHGFAATPGGQSDWAWKLATIAGAMQETCDQDGLLALLACKDQYQTFRDTAVEQLEMADDAKRVAVEDRELFRFGVVQREDRGWIALDAEAEYEMRLQHVQPNSWIVPPRMLNFVALGQKAETEYYRAGDEARANLRQGGDNFASFRGKKVFETKPYSLDVDGRVLDPLTRERMIGDYFVEPIYDNTVRTSFYCCESDRFEERKDNEGNVDNVCRGDDEGAPAIPIPHRLRDNVSKSDTNGTATGAHEIVTVLHNGSKSEKQDYDAAWWAYNMYPQAQGAEAFEMVKDWIAARTASSQSALNAENALRR